MGFDKASCEFLIHAQKRFNALQGNLLTLGRQQMFTTPGEVHVMAAAHGVPFNGQASWTKGSGYCEAFFTGLGASKVDSMDASDYEQATIIHDLNVPVDSTLQGRFDCVIDGGTIEHVFHFPNAILSAMRMVAPNGHYIAITPGNNQMGHGFYQFSPELYFRIFCPANGFEMRTMLLRTPTEWLEVADPKVVGTRGNPYSSVPLMLAFIAQRVGGTEHFHIPQQSDYAEAWSVVDSIRTGTRRAQDSALRHAIRRYVPVQLKTLLRRTQQRLKPGLTVEGMSTLDPAHFKKVKL